MLLGRMPAPRRSAAARRQRNVLASGAGMTISWRWMCRCALPAKVSDYPAQAVGEAVGLTLRIMSKATRGPRKGRNARRPRIMFVTPAQFREAREFTGKTREDVADLLGVSVRTVGNWETGAARVPYAGFSRDTCKNAP